MNFLGFSPSLCARLASPSMMSLSSEQAANSFLKSGRILVHVRWAAVSSKSLTLEASHSSASPLRQRLKFAYVVISLSYNWIIVSICQISTVWSFQVSKLNFHCKKTHPETTKKFGNWANWFSNLMITKMLIWIQKSLVIWSSNIQLFDLNKNVEMKLKFGSDSWIRFYNSTNRIDFRNENWIEKS